MGLGGGEGGKLVGGWFGRGKGVLMVVGGGESEFGVLF